MHSINDRTAEMVTLAQAQAGDRDAFGMIYDRYVGAIYNFTYRMMADHDDAYDLTTDTFLKLHRTLPRLASDSNISAWLHRAATNTCLDALRRRQRLRWLPWEAPKHDPLLVSGIPDQPEAAVERAETVAAVQATLARLTPRDRALLLLFENDGMNCYEIGAVLGMSRSAVKSARFRAMIRFRAAWAVVTGEGRVVA